MKKLTIIYALVLSFFSVVTLCMENDVHIIDPHVVVFDIFLKNQNKCLSHEIIYALAAVNKSCKKFLLDTAPERGEYLLRKVERRDSLFLPQKPYYFNKYGSLMCDRGGTIDLLYKYVLADDEIKGDCGFWEKCSRRVVSLPQPFLTPEGNLCRYGWGKDEDFAHWVGRQHIFRYCVTPDNKQEHFSCGVRINEHEACALSLFSELPNLLKALVNCSVTRDDCLINMMFVALKDAIIPDNYEEYQGLDSDFFDGTTFDDLPKALKEAIIARYQECKKLKVEAQDAKCA